MQVTTKPFLTQHFLTRLNIKSERGEKGFERRDLFKLIYKKCFIPYKKLTLLRFFFLTGFRKQKKDVVATLGHTYINILYIFRHLLNAAHKITLNFMPTSNVLHNSQTMVV